LLLFLFSLGGVPGAWADDAPLPVEAFASLPQLQGVQLSPDGKKVAALMNVKGDTLLIVRVMGSSDLFPLAKTNNKLGAINWFHWANNERVVVSLRFPMSRNGTDTMENRLVSFRYDGSKSVDLLRRRPTDGWVPQIQDRVIDWLPEDPDHILVAADFERPLVQGIYNINVETGGRLSVRGRQEENVVRWVTDRQHRQRVGVKFKGTEYEVIVSDPDRNEWSTAWKYSSLSEQVISPIGFGADPNILYVAAYHKGHEAIFTVDLRDPQRKLALKYADPNNDVGDKLVYSEKAGDYIGIAAQDGGSYHFWHPEYQGLAGGIDKALPDTRNTIVGFSEDESRYLVFAFGNKRPGVYYFGDRTNKSLIPFGSTYPQLKPELLAGKQTVHYRSRDGKDIEGFLTVPRGRTPKALPLVVFPHGGPIAGDDTNFDYWTEFFASRGYVVLQMNFRGSAGSGYDFMAAGLKQWGLGMQDDISDGVQAMIDVGIADKNRVCIVGASFGGYAALMGAAKTPHLYKCAISFAGVSDLSEFVLSQRRYIIGKVAQLQIGSLDKDKEQLRNTSPRWLAEQIRIPILLVHGTKDRSVPFKQSQLMAEALDKAGKSYRFIEQEEGDHFLSNYENRLQLFQEMEKFLAQNL